VGFQIGVENPLIQCILEPAAYVSRNYIVATISGSGLPSLCRGVMKFCVLGNLSPSRRGVLIFSRWYHEVVGTLLDRIY